MIRLKIEEFLALLKENLGMYLSPEESELLEDAKKKNSVIIKGLKSEESFDVYLTGHIDFETVRMFYEITRKLEDFGVKVYHPAMVVLGSKEKGIFEFNIERKSRILLVVTDTASFGTSVDVGFFTHRKLSGEDVKIIYCYTGPSYEFKEIKKHPSSVYIDYFTDDVEDALKKVLELLGKPSL
ncbi:hypothetical protein [Pyrococcus kukulkanii]|uniref:Uncharacterized protein n=1 Tax=Pyrococcus kukulkanii TaxID=1609559 RepID=A0A127BC78_9EURY|nr:hypothetical protein [Pyrococcus kukulkanii]AMM54266.1 hypothetical protein TQ32_07095 [Pyrococcus kukulkanii]